MARARLETERTIRLLLEYEGTRYGGWQIQTNALTVQEVVERAVAETVGHAARIHGAGRTDAGVHARGQVAHFRSDAPLAPEELQRALNARLPRDVAVRGARVVPDDFHARFSARGKTYAYTLLNAPVPSVLDRHFHWRVPHALDGAAMEAAAALLCGRHDFRGFATLGDRTDPVRSVRRLEIRRLGPRWLLLVEADGFLWRMVRRITGALVTVGRGRRPPSWVGEVLEAKGALAGGPAAPPQGLTLLHVDYGDAEDPPPVAVHPGGFFLGGEGIPL